MPEPVKRSTRRKKMFTCYLREDQDKALRELHAATAVPIAVLIREGIDLVLEKRNNTTV